MLQYKEEIFDLLNLILPLKSKHAHETVATIFEHILGALCGTYTSAFDEDRAKLDLPLNVYLPIRVNKF